MTLINQEVLIKAVFHKVDRQGALVSNSKGVKARALCIGRLVAIITLLFSGVHLFQLASKGLLMSPLSLKMRNTLSRSRVRLTFRKPIQNY